MMVELASAVPVRVGVASLVMLSPSVPVSDAEASNATGGAEGAMVSIVMIVAEEADEMFPATSVAFVV